MFMPGERLWLHQRIHVQEAGGGSPPGVEVDLRLGAEHGDPVLGLGVLREPGADHGVLGEERAVGAVDDVGEGIGE